MRSAAKPQRCPPPSRRDVINKLVTVETVRLAFVPEKTVLFEAWVEGGPRAIKIICFIIIYILHRICDTFSFRVVFSFVIYSSLFCLFSLLLFRNGSDGKQFAG